jgi:hypothetical protein
VDEALGVLSEGGGEHGGAHFSSLGGLAEVDLGR